MKKARINTLRYYAEQAEPLPDNMQAWLYKHVFKHVHYMFFTKIEKGLYMGTCECCRSLIPLRKAKSGEYIKCGGCGKKVKLRDRRFSVNIEELRIFSYIQKIKEGYMQRLFRAIKLNNDIDWRVKIVELQRDVFAYNADTKHYSIIKQYSNREKYSYGTGTYTRVWECGRYNCGAYGMGPLEEKPICLYPHNIKGLFSDSPFKYSALNIYAEHTTVNPLEYLLTYLKYPQLEYLVKGKFYRLAFDLVRHDNLWYGHNDFPCAKGKTNIAEFLGLSDKKDIRLIQRQDLNSRQIAFYKKVYKPAFKVFNRGEFDFLCCHGSDRRLKSITEIISLHSLYLYAKKQCTEKQLCTFLSDYYDYIDACKYLKLNVRDTMFLKPHNFKKAHDEYTARANEERARIRDAEAAKARAAETKLFVEAVKTYSALYEFAEDKYCLIAPRCREDLDAEGGALSHCVGGYVNRIADKSTVIMFVRKTAEPGKPFFTLELNPKDKRIVQCRGEHNKNAPPEIYKFLDKWMAAKVDPQDTDSRQKQRVPQPAQVIQAAVFA